MTKELVTNLFENTVFETTSPLSGHIKIVESSGIRRLIVQGYTQSKSLDKNGLTQGYWDGFRKIELLETVPKKALILGLGAGTIPVIWKEVFPDLKIDIVEIDPTIAEIAKKYFEVPKDLNIYISDGAKFVSETSNVYDLVVVDVYTGGKFDKDCETEEFLQNLAKITAAQGVAIFNR